MTLRASISLLLLPLLLGCSGMQDSAYHDSDPNCAENQVCNAQLNPLLEMREVDDIGELTIALHSDRSMDCLEAGACDDEGWAQSIRDYYERYPEQAPNHKLASTMAQFISRASPSVNDDSPLFGRGIEQSDTVWAEHSDGVYIYTRSPDGYVAAGDEGSFITNGSSTITTTFSTGDSQ